MIEIKLTKRYPNSRTEDITDAYMRGWNDGCVKGVARAYEDIRKAIETSTIRQYGDTFKWEVSADTPQTERSE